MNALRSNSAQHMAEAARSGWTTADGYRKLAELARTLGMEAEAERCERNADEFEGDAEECAERAILLGYDPE